MPIDYKGRDPVLIREFERVRPKLDARYREIFGKVDYERLDKVTKRVLTPESYIHSLEDAKTQFGELIPAVPKNARLLFTSEDFDIHNLQKGKRYACSAAIYANADCINHSSYTGQTDNPLVPFIHEYNHFVWFALQKVPFYVMQAALLDELKPPGVGKVNTLSQLEKLEQIDMSPAERRSQISLILGDQLFTKIYEDTNRILDKMVLEALDIDVDYSWRGTPKKYAMLTIESLKQKVAIPVGGDSLAQFDDVEAVRRTLNWEKYLTASTNDDGFRTLVEKTKKLRFHKISLTDMIADDS